MILGLYGAYKSDKLERQARETQAEACDMRLNSSRKKKESEKKAVDTCRTLLVRKNATIHNLRGFKDTLSQIINIGFVIDDGELDEIEDFNIDTLKSYESYREIKVNALSNGQVFLEMVNPFTGGIAGSMIRDAERLNERADLEWERAKATESSNLAAAEIYDQISYLSGTQKDILTKLNSFFNRCHKEVRELISQKGTARKNYSDEVCEKILLLMKCAKCMNAYVGVQLMNKKYEITDQAKKIMSVTKHFIESI